MIVHILKMCTGDISSEQSLVLFTIEILKGIIRSQGVQWLSGRDRGVAGSSLTGVTVLCP